MTAVGSTEPGLSAEEVDTRMRTRESSKQRAPRAKTRLGATKSTTAINPGSPSKVFLGPLHKRSPWRRRRHDRPSFGSTLGAKMCRRTGANEVWKDRWAVGQRSRRCVGCRKLKDNQQLEICRQARRVGIAKLRWRQRAPAIARDCRSRTSARARCMRCAFHIQRGWRYGDSRSGWRERSQVMTARARLALTLPTPVNVVNHTMDKPPFSTTALERLQGDAET